MRIPIVACLVALSSTPAIGAVSFHSLAASYWTDAGVDLDSDGSDDIVIYGGVPVIGQYGKPQRVEPLGSSLLAISEASGFATSFSEGEFVDLQALTFFAAPKGGRVGGFGFDPSGNPLAEGFGFTYDTTGNITSGPLFHVDYFIVKLTGGMAWIDLSLPSSSLDYSVSWGYSDSTYNFTITPVPEPSCLAGGSLALFSISFRRKRPSCTLTTAHLALR